MIGTTLSHFRITAKLGEGGMGEVYRAEDTKLGREVAVKVLPEAVASDPERLARFEREAKVLASLNHPNIAAIYSLEAVTADAEPGPLHFLVMELAEGEDLRQVLDRGAIAPEEALPIALQVAQALETAHERGIIHRDLKPANVMIGADGQVKVLDFGLAKALDPASLDAGDTAEPSGAGSSPSPPLLSMSPTLTAQMTQAGVILGTAAYMAPEQAKGQPVDRRSDIFSFGIVLYEMLTGKKAFPGDDVSEMLASILKTEPDWQALPADIDPRARDILRRCLRKDPKTRRQSIGDVRIEIQEILDGPPAPPLQTEARPAAWGRQVAIGLAALTLGLLIAGGASWWTPEPAPPAPIRFKVTAEGELPRASGTLLDISADGKTLVYSARQEGTERLYSRPMDQVESSPIAGTEDGSNPFLSPDGTWVGFDTDLSLKKVLISGGTASTICDCGTVRSVAWGSDDKIYFTDASSTIAAIPSTSGTPESVTQLAGDETTHRGISVLPDASALLFAALSGGRETAVVVAQSLETGERKTLVEGTHPRYTPTGHLLFARSDALWAVPFDAETLSLRGEPIPVIERVRQEPVGAVQYEVSQEGTLVYVPATQGEALRESLHWVDRSGEATPIPTGQGFLRNLRISPNGREIALQITAEDGSTNVWLLDLDRGALDPLTTGTEFNRVPVWSPDGDRIAYSREAGGAGLNLHVISLDGSEPEMLLQLDHSQTATSWSPDGTTIAFRSLDPETGSDSWTLSLEDRTASPLFTTPAAEGDVQFSPEGGWIAFTSDETGQDEVYVTSFPDPGRRSRVSTGGGFHPRWSADGSELFYMTEAGDLMTVPVSGDQVLSVGAPVRLFQLATMDAFDVHPDGQRFAVIQSHPSAESTQIHVVQNWFTELERLVPTD